MASTLEMFPKNSYFFWNSSLWKISYIFLYFPEWNSALFSLSSRDKKIHPEKISYTSGNGTPKFFLHFRKQNFILFSETKLSYISGNKTYFYFVHLEPKKYSEHCQTSTMESFAKNSYLAYFFIFCKTELFISGLEK